ncbi:MAG: TonB family protein [Bdellovibrionales bacterium]|nr:TonB family protein [Bdellovibrionales bacterium]
MFQRVRNSVLLFLLCSVFLHISIWSGLQIFKSQPKVPPAPAVEIVILDQAPAPQPAQPVDKTEQQIVDQSENPLNDEMPDKAKYLSRHNQRVERETRAAQVGKFNNDAKPGSAQPGSLDAEKVARKEKPQKSLTSGTLPTLAALKPNFSPTPPGPTRPDQTQPGSPSQTDDYLKDTEVGMQTLLSTREFVYYSYYARIKEKIRQHWEPSVKASVQMVARQGRAIASARDRRTRVMITLDKNGTLLQVQVIGESGIIELDNAAIDAFRAAAPFPNPPQGMVEQDGNIRIRWDFILEA